MKIKRATANYVSEHLGETPTPEQLSKILNVSIDELLIGKKELNDVKLIPQEERKELKDIKLIIQIFSDENDKITIVNDAYNASPDSMEAALKILGRYKNRKVAILGDMFEMGEHTEYGHRLVGKSVINNTDV